MIKKEVKKEIKKEVKKEVKEEVKKVVKEVFKINIIAIEDCYKPLNLYLDQDTEGRIEFSNAEGPIENFLKTT